MNFEKQNTKLEVRTAYFLLIRLCLRNGMTVISNLYITYRLHLTCTCKKEGVCFLLKYYPC